MEYRNHEVAYLPRASAPARTGHDRHAAPAIAGGAGRLRDDGPVPPAAQHPALGLAGLPGHCLAMVAGAVAVAATYRAQPATVAASGPAPAAAVAAASG